MAVHDHIGLKSSEQILKILARELESFGTVVKRKEDRVIDFPRVTGIELGTPIRQLFQAIFHARLIRNIIGITGKGIHCRQRVTPVAGDKIRGGREILVMPACQPPALRISRAQFSLRGRHSS